MTPVIVVAFSLLIIFSTPPVVFAKGTTTKILITSAELRSPIELSDPEILENFNVWSGPGTFANGVEGHEGFIVDWASGVVTERPSGLRNFQLSFYVRYANRPFGRTVSPQHEGDLPRTRGTLVSRNRCLAARVQERVQG